MIEIAISYPRKPEWFSRRIAARMSKKHQVSPAGSHVLLIYKGTVWHCVEGGPCTVPLRDFLKEYELLEREILPSTRTTAELEAYLEGSLLGPYSWFQAIAIRFPFFQRYRFFQNKNKETNCAEWVARILLYAGVKAPEFLHSDFLDPYEVFYAAKRATIRNV